MEVVWEWIADNSEWVFGGVGTTLVCGVVAYVVNRKRKSSDQNAPTNQIVGGNGVTGQSFTAGRDVVINNKSSEKPDKPTIIRASAEDVARYDPKTRSLLSNIQVKNRRFEETANMKRKPTIKTDYIIPPLLLLVIIILAISLLVG